MFLVLNVNEQQNKKCLRQVKKHLIVGGSEGSFSAHTDHQIIQCQGCETISFRVISENSEEIDFYYDEDGTVIGNHVQTITLYPS